MLTTIKFIAVHLALLSLLALFIFALVTMTQAAPVLTMSALVINAWVLFSVIKAREANEDGK